MPRDREKQRIAQRRYEKKRRQRPEYKEKRKKYQKEYYQRPEVKERVKERSQRPKRKEYKKKYIKRYQQQPENKKRTLDLRRNNPIYKKRHQLRQKVNQAVIHQKCYISTIHKLIGCSVPEARDHLESQFEPWMSWDNYGKGKGKWCIDHIIRVNSIDIFDEDEVKRIFHYKNMRPLCFVKNSADTDDR